MTHAPVHLRPKPRRRSGIVVPEQVTLGGRLAARLVYSVVRLVDASLRYRWEVASATRDRIAAGPVIFAIWHNRLALCLRVYDRYVRPLSAERHLAAMVSASRDGGLLARVLELFNVQPVRGSSSRRGPQAMLELTSWANRGYDLALTPDGPRGPAYTVQDGVVMAAQLTGLPVVPVSITLRWKWQVKSWDRFQVPLPFSSVVGIMGEPVSVGRDLSDEERARSRQLLEDRLKSITVD